MRKKKLSKCRSPNWWLPSQDGATAPWSCHSGANSQGLPKQLCSALGEDSGQAPVRAKVAPEATQGMRTCARIGAMNPIGLVQSLGRPRANLTLS